MRKHITGVILISVGFLLIAAALALVGYNMWDDYRAQQAVSEAYDRIIQILPSKLPDSEGHIPMPSDPPADSELPDYVRDPYKEMPSKLIGSYEYIGMLTVPTLELELPIIKDWDYNLLRMAPCRYSGSVYLNNLTICAHNYASFFGRIDRLLPGDIVIFTDMDGNVFNYEVSELENLEGTAIEEMKTADDWDLTLFTCTRGGQLRITLRCRLVK